MGKKFVKFTINNSGDLIYKKSGRTAGNVTIKGKTVYKNGRKYGTISKPDKKSLEKNRVYRRNRHFKGLKNDNGVKAPKPIKKEYNPILQKYDYQKRMENLKNICLKTKDFESYEKLRKIKEKDYEKFFEIYDEVEINLGYGVDSDGNLIETSYLVSRNKIFFDTLFDELGV